VLLLKLEHFNPIVQELDNVVEELEKIAVVNLLQHRSIISLVGNVQHSSLILEKVHLFSPLEERLIAFLLFIYFPSNNMYILRSGIQCVPEEQDQCADDLSRSI